MNFEQLGDFSKSFWLLQGDAIAIGEVFFMWQQGILLPWGQDLVGERCGGSFEVAIERLKPRTSPTMTKYLIWPLNSNWVVFLDNGVNGTDGTAPSVVAGRMGIQALRVCMAEHIVDPATKRVVQYGATVLEVHVGGEERRHVYVANDGGRWKFGQQGEPFDFEDTSAYSAKNIRDRFTRGMILQYLAALGVPLRETQQGIGILISKVGDLPATLQMHFD